MRNQAGNRLRQTRWRPLTSKRRCHAIFDKRKSPNTLFGTGEGLALTQKWHVVSLLGLWRFGWLEATKTNPGPDTGDWRRAGLRTSGGIDGVIADRALT